MKRDQLRIRNPKQPFSKNEKDICKANLEIIAVEILKKNKSWAQMWIRKTCLEHRRQHFWCETQSGFFCGPNDDQTENREIVWLRLSWQS